MKKVLLVDDVKLFLELEKTILSKRNVQIFTASSGHEAIAINRKERVDLILCDLNMPGMNGDEMCRTIRSDAINNTVSIVIVTSFASEDDIDKCKKAGVNDYITKPINPIELLKKLSEYTNVSIRSSPRLLVWSTVEKNPGSDVELFIGTTLNISSSGFLVETSHSFNLGEIAYFSVAIPDRAIQINAKGEVVRKSVCAESNLSEYGIKFTDITTEDREAIEKYIRVHSQDTV